MSEFEQKTVFTTIKNRLADMTSVLIERQQKIMYENKTLFFNFFLTALICSFFVVHVDLNKPHDLRIPIIPFLSSILLVFDAIPIFFIVPGFIICFALIWYSISQYLTKDQLFLLNSYKRGLPTLFISLDRIMLLIPTLIINSILGSVLGNLLAGIYHLTAYRLTRFIPFTFPTVYNRNYLFWLKGFYFDYIALIFIVLFVLCFIITFVQIRNINNVEKENKPPRERILISEVVKLIKDHEFLLLISLNLFFMILFYFSIIQFFIQLDVYLILTTWFSRFLSLNGVAILLSLAIILYIQYIIYKNRDTQLKKPYLMLFILLDSIILVESLNIISNYHTLIQSMLHDVLFGEYRYVIFTLLAMLTLGEILSRELFGFFGLFVIYGTIVTDIVNASQSTFLSILLTSSALILIFTFSKFVSQFTESIGRNLLKPIANLIGENIFRTIPKIIDSRSHVTKMGSQIIFILVMFSIFSSLTFQTALDLNADEARWNVGSDIKLLTSPEAEFNTVPTENINYINSHPQVSTVTPIYVNKYYFTGYSHQTATTELIFIDTSSFLRTAFYRDDWFVGGTAKELIGKMQKKPGYIILDSKRANILDKKINDTLVLHTGIENELHLTVRIIGFVNYFTSGYKIDERGIKSFGIMNRQFATPEVQNPFGGYSQDTNPVDFYLAKTSLLANQYEVMQDLISNSNIKFVESGNNFVSELYRTRNINVNAAVTQILGISSIIALILIPMVFTQFPISVDENEKRFYESMSFDFEPNQIRKMLALDVGLSILAPSLAGYVLGVLLSFLSNHFMPKTTLPIVTSFGSIFTLFQFILLGFLFYIWYGNTILKYNLIFKHNNDNDTPHFTHRIIPNWFLRLVKGEYTYLGSIKTSYKQLVAGSFFLGLILIIIHYVYTSEIKILNQIFFLIPFLLGIYIAIILIRSIATTIIATDISFKFYLTFLVQIVLIYLNPTEYWLMVFVFINLVFVIYTLLKTNTRYSRRKTITIISILGISVNLVFLFLGLELLNVNEMEEILLNFLSLNIELPLISYCLLLVQIIIYVKILLEFSQSNMNFKT